MLHTEITCVIGSFDLKKVRDRRERKSVEMRSNYKINRSNKKVKI